MTRDEIKAMALQIHWIEEAGVHIRQLSFLERAKALSSKVVSNEDNFESKMQIVIAGTCDADGTLLFIDSDRDWLQHKNYAWIDYVANSILSHSWSLTVAKKDSEPTPQSNS